MANLLPQSYMRTIQRERAYRRAVVVFWFVLFTVVLAILFLVPSLLLSRSKEQEVSSQVAFLQAYTASQEESDIGREVRDIRRHLEALQPLVTDRLVSEVLDELLNEQDAGIRLTSMRYVFDEQTPENLGSVDIQGIARDRNALVSFAGRLERNVLFGSVNLPVSELAARDNIPFSLQFIVVKKNAAL